MLRARAVHDVGNGAAQTEHVLFVGVSDDRHDEPVVERHGDPQVDVFLVHDVVAVDRGVDDGMAPERVDDGFGNERHERQPGAKPLVFRFLGMANLLDGREVHVEHRMDVRRCPPAEDHVLGDLLANHRHRLDVDPVARLVRRDVRWGRDRRGRSRRVNRLAVEIIEDVVFGDTPANARARYPSDVDVVLARDAAYERRRSLPPQVVLHQLRPARLAFAGRLRPGRQRCGFFHLRHRLGGR